MILILSLSSKQLHFRVKQLVFIGIQLIKEYKSIVNDLIKTIQATDNTLYKLNLTKILKKRFFITTQLHLNKIWKPTQRCFRELGHN